MEKIEFEYDNKPGLYFTWRPANKISPRTKWYTIHCPDGIFDSLTGLSEFDIESIEDLWRFDSDRATGYIPAMIAGYYKRFPKI
jgi:hypothetical protein